MFSNCVLHLLQLGHGGGLPERPPPNYEANDDFLRAAHHVLLEVVILMYYRNTVHCGVAHVL